MSEEERAAEPEAAAASAAAESPDHAAAGTPGGEEPLGAEETSRAATSAQHGDQAGDPSPDTTGGAPGTLANSLAAELERRVAELERELERERDAASDYLGRWQRAQADFNNFRRRQQQEQEQLRRFLAAEATRLILPALDSFERAFATLPPSLRRLTWIDGMALVSLQLQQSLQALGVQPIAAEAGHPFDPARHEAIGEVETAEHPAGHIAVVVQRGYEVDGAVLRPALVQVARAPGEEETLTPEAAPTPTTERPPDRPTAEPAGDGPAP